MARGIIDRTNKSWSDKKGVKCNKIKINVDKVKKVVNKTINLKVRPI